MRKVGECTKLVRDKHDIVKESMISVKMYIKTFQCLCRWITMMRVLLLPRTDQILGHKEGFLFYFLY